MIGINDLPSEMVKFMLQNQNYKDLRKCAPRVGTLTEDIIWSMTSLPYWLTYCLHCSEERRGGGVD